MRLRQPSGLVDMSMNLPPRFENQSLTTSLFDAARQLEDQGLELLMRYQEPGGIMKDREIGTSWLSRRLPDITPDRVLLSAGAQGALLAVLSILTEPGDLVCTEHLTYPGFRSVAAHLRLKLIPLEMDENGLIPEAFEMACRASKIKALYCVPTLHNPTTRTIPSSRRQQLVESDLLSKTWVFRPGQIAGNWPRLICNRKHGFSSLVKLPEIGRV